EGKGRAGPGAEAAGVDGPGAGEAEVRAGAGGGRVADGNRYGRDGRHDHGDGRGGAQEGIRDRGRAEGAESAAEAPGRLHEVAAGAEIEKRAGARRLDRSGRAAGHTA